jgi:hypothetical protein
MLDAVFDPQSPPPDLSEAMSAESLAMAHPMLRDIRFAGRLFHQQDQLTRWQSDSKWTGDVPGIAMFLFGPRLLGAWLPGHQPIESDAPTPFLNDANGAPPPKASGGLVEAIVARMDVSSGRSVIEQRPQLAQAVPVLTPTTGVNLMPVESIHPQSHRESGASTTTGPASRETSLTLPEAGTNLIETSEVLPGRFQEAPTPTATLQAQTAPSLGDILERNVLSLENGIRRFLAEMESVGGGELSPPTAARPLGWYISGLLGGALILEVARRRGRQRRLELVPTAAQVTTLTWLSDLHDPFGTSE